MTNSSSTDVTFRGAWCNKVAATQEDSHSTAPADQQTSEEKIVNNPSTNNTLN